jgi:cell volume regulation protein A
VFLTVALLGLVAAGRRELELSLVWLFAQQFAIGALLGIVGGRALAWLINRLTLISGLYPLLAAAGGVLIYALAAQLGGSGFLAIYLAGVVLGNSKLQAAQTIFRVHDGLAWLAQIVMFLLLGLLATPSQLVMVAGPALAVAAFLMLVARPAAVALCLLPFRFPWREQLYIGWVGLRGAVPIVLALFPMMYGVENAHAYFNVAFFVVLVSLLAQGWTIAPAARRLRLEVPPVPEPLQRVALDVPGHYGQELACYHVAPGSLAAGREVASLRLPAGLQLAALVREDRPQPLEAALRFQAGDYAWFVGEASAAADIGRLFHLPQARAHLDEQHYFGEFELSGEARVDEVAEAYGIAVPPSAGGRTLAEHFARAFHGRPSVGDTLPFGAAMLVVRSVESARVARIGLRLPPRPEG